MANSGAAIHAVTPSDSGPPIANPMKPAACCRPAGACGDPAHRCHSPSAGSVIIAEPSTSRGRDSGSGSDRVNVTATITATMGSSTTAEPISVRSAESTHWPTGRAASNQLLAAISTATASSASAIPSRRWPGSMSWARPTERAALPVALATISQVARAPRPTARAPAVTEP